MIPENNLDYSDEEEIEEIIKTAENIFGLNLDRIIQSGSKDNVVGIKSDHILFSQRLDSRTIFIQDKRYGINREYGFFNAEDKLQLEKCHEILEKLGIPLSEIRKEKIYKEKTQEAELDRDNNLYKKYEVREGKKFAKIYRQIEGIYVWSSDMILSLTDRETIGFMQLHWPDIPRNKVIESHRLQYKIQHNWNTPQEKNCEVENIEAGIIHSPAISFFMDIYPAIRVTYRALNDKGGKKKVLYFDRHGKKIPTPRQIEITSDHEFQKRSVNN